LADPSDPKRREPRSLPPSPDLASLKKQAKAMLRRYRAGEPLKNVTDKQLGFPFPVVD